MAHLAAVGLQLLARHRMAALLHCMPSESIGRFLQPEELASVIQTKGDRAAAK
jgi:hypothetical protein